MADRIIEVVKNFEKVFPYLISIAQFYLEFFFSSVFTFMHICFFALFPTSRPPAGLTLILR